VFAMIDHRTKIRRHLRSSRVAALTPEERLEELRAAEARCAARHGSSEQAGVEPAHSDSAPANSGTLTRNPQRRMNGPPAGPPRSSSE
jgi:uncharacterized membrane-anchored protein YhcB (DUF1043 family)